MEAKVIDAGIVLGKSPAVVGLTYDLEKLVIDLDPDVPGKNLKSCFRYSTWLQMS